MQSLPFLLCTRDRKPPAVSADEIEWKPEGVPPAWMPASIMSEMAPMSPIKDTLSSAQDTLQDAGRLILNGVRNVV